MNNNTQQIVVGVGAVIGFVGLFWLVNKILDPNSKNVKLAYNENGVTLETSNP